MNIEQLFTTLQLREDKECEFKSAKGGLPRSLWETYSAMANTEGGYIVLGVKEAEDGRFEIQGLDNPLKIEKDFWSIINNRGKVSINLLHNADAQLYTVAGKVLFVIEVPWASRRQRPVFLDQNPLTGTFRRYNDGDYKCSESEVRRMLSDQSEQSADSRILSLFSENDLDSDSINQYRNRFSARNPNHPWLTLDIREFLEKLGGWRHDRQSKQEGVTTAGLLMFGKEDALRSPENELKFHIDYRERRSDAIADRWNDRLTPDGTWTPNLFQFFQKVYPKLVEGLKLPFGYQHSPEENGYPVRQGTSPVHEAIQEALVNALIHADYQGQGGIVIERFQDRLELSNPGTLLVSLEQWRWGAVSECRNPSLQLMFQLLGIGDKAGSGVDKIRQGWNAQKWRWPHIEPIQQPDRVRLTLPMVSLFTEESLAKLRLLPGFDQLVGHEVVALVAADVEGSVNNRRLQQFSTEHATDITKMLQGLVARGFLAKNNYGRWTTYQLAVEIPSNSMRNEGNLPHLDESLPHLSESLPHSGGNLPHLDGNPPHSEEFSMRLGPDLPRSLIKRLLAISAVAREKKSLSSEKIYEIIRNLCQVCPLTVVQIAELLQRTPKGIRDRYISKMVEKDAIQPLFPEPNHPQQAYKTNSDRQSID